jgi:hypothetical protein
LIPENYLEKAKKCVTFLFTDEKNPKPIGTAFFVGIELKKYFVVYMITAKHVLKKSGKLDDSELLSSIRMRLNNKNGILEYSIRNISKSEVLSHEDGNVDLIAINITLSQNHFDYLFIHEKMFTDEKILNENNIGEGSKVFFVGLFGNFYGNQRNYPVLRFGNISLMTKEKLIIDDNEPSKLAHVYLIECQSMGGFSGSPVFLEKERITEDKLYFSPEFYLGGIMKGHYRDRIYGNYDTLNFNLGLAMITPCYILKEILYSEKAKRQRELLENEEQSKRNSN